MRRCREKASARQVDTCDLSSLRRQAGPCNQRLRQSLRSTQSLGTIKHRDSVASVTTLNAQIKHLWEDSQKGCHWGLHVETCLEGESSNSEGFRNLPALLMSRDHGQLATPTLDVRYRLALRAAAPLQQHCHRAL